MELLNQILPQILTIVATLVLALVGYVANKVKIVLDTKEKKEAVYNSVLAVEQIANAFGLDSAGKKEKAKEYARVQLEKIGIKISDVELDVLIEAVVLEFTKEINK